MVGKIIKGVAGFYYVHVEACGVYECRARGSFRKQKKKPLVGDDVEITVLSEEKKEGWVVELLPRRSELLRPAVANPDQAVMLFALAEPAPNFNLLDRFLALTEWQGLPAILCFNKRDLVPKEEAEKVKERYKKAGYRTVSISVEREENIEELRGLLRGKTTALAGPSGVGKSSLVNLLYPEALMETGEISRKIQRGRHTTRHSELFFIEHGTYIFDTPGFSSLYIDGLLPEDLGKYFPEIRQEEERCRFTGCAHIDEPDCAVKLAAAEGRIAKERYESYKQLYRELKSLRKY